MNAMQDFSFKHAPEQTRELEKQIIADPDCSMVERSMLPHDERNQPLVEWNQTARDFPALPLHQLVEAQVLRTPDAIAIQDEQEQLTYRELNRRANRLAHYLRTQGVVTETLVALLARRSVKFVVTVLAIFKANAVYLPLDPRHPHARHQQILEQSQCRYLLLEDEWLPAFTGKEGVKGTSILPLEGCLTQKMPETDLVLPTQPEQLAYVIYTSGSTGIPKGAMIEQRGMVNHLWAKVHDLQLNEQDVIAQSAMQSFDISVWQMLVGLIIGARVQVVSDDVVLNPRRLLAAIVRDGITIVEVVPSLLRAMLHEVANQPIAPELPTLRWLIPTGEALPPDLCRQWFTYYPAIPLLNAYGPTECSDDVTHYPIYQPLPEQTIHTPIGRPIANLRTYVLDPLMQPGPIGVAGELWVSGIGVGRGYLHDMERTAQAFLPMPAHLLPKGSGESDDTIDGTVAANSRLYRTGDLARYREDGNLEFLGRIDHQVKIRGFRIELEEIEFVLRQHPSVQDCVVTAHPHPEPPHESRLVAYVVYNQSAPAATDEVKQFIQERLPAYMIPALIIRLAALPLTANGKLDRAALPTPEIDAAREAAYRAPQTVVEKWLASQMRKVLGDITIGVDDDFFRLGGDSIRAAILINQLQQELQAILYVTALFDASTIAKLSLYLQKHYPQALARVCDYQPPPTQKACERIDGAMIARFRQLIPPYTAAATLVQSRNQRAIFVLSSPRSGSTLLRVMLGGHPQLFAPPELDLLNFSTVGERKTALQDRFAFRLEGLLRALMELHRCNPDQARQMMVDYEEKNLDTHTFYGLLQQWIGADRMLVDKTPAYALDPAILQRAESEFQEPLYLHLTRHPMGMIQSFEEAHTDQVFFRYEHDFSPRQLAELTWLVSHQNILNFLQSIPKERRLLLRYEDLVKEPVATMQQVSEFLQVPFEQVMAQPYQDKEKRMTDGLYPVSKMLGDAKFHTHQQVESANAERWQSVYTSDFLSEATWQMAKSLGYQRFAERLTASAIPITGEPQTDVQQVVPSTPDSTTTDEELLHKLYNALEDQSQILQLRQALQPKRSRPRSLQMLLRLPQPIAMRLWSWTVQQSWAQQFYLPNQTKLVQQFLASLEAPTTQQNCLAQALFFGSLTYFKIRDAIFQRIRIEGRSIPVEGAAMLEAARVRQQGVILLSNHAYQTSYFRSLKLTQRGVGNLERLVEPIQSDKIKAQYILYARQLDLARQVLQNGGAITIAPDVNRGRGASITVPFHGRMHEFRTGFAELALLTDAQLFFVASDLQAYNCFSFRLVGPFDQGSATMSYAERVQYLMEQYIAHLRLQWVKNPWALSWEVMREHLAYPPARQFTEMV
jgi:amino acid adenylation domain-containing protein